MARRRSGFYYKTESISEYTNDVFRDVRGMCRDMTMHMGKKLESSIKAFTPVDTGKLQESIAHGAVVELRPNIFVTSGAFRNRMGATYIFTAGSYEIDVESEVDYAPSVEFGTGQYGLRGAKYEIKPRNQRALKFFWEKIGKEVSFARVMHPGIEGRHMFAKGAKAIDNNTYINKELKPYVMAWQAKHAVARSVT